MVGILGCGLLLVMVGGGCWYGVTVEEPMVKVGCGFGGVVWLALGSLFFPGLFPFGGSASVGGCRDSWGFPPVVGAVGYGQ